MKKILMLAMVILFVVPTVVLATETRVGTMGNVNHIVEDDANIWLYPSTLVNYPGLLTMEFDAGAAYMMGANWNAGPGVLGAYFSTVNYEYSWSNIYPWTLNNFYGAGLNSPDMTMLDDVDHRIDLFYGMDYADIPVGVRVSLYTGGEKWENEYEYYDLDFPYDSNYEWSLCRKEISVGASPMEGALDVAFGYTTTTWTDEGTWVWYEGADLKTETAPFSEPDGNTTMTFDARYWMEPRGDWTPVPYFHFMKGSFAFDAYDFELWMDGADYLHSAYVEHNAKVDITSFNVGMGTNYQVSDHAMTVTDVGFYSYKKDSEITFNPDPSSTGEIAETYTLEEAWTGLPYFRIGMDAEVRDWLDLRCGVFSYWYKRTWEDNLDAFEEAGADDQFNNRKYEATYASTGLYLGLGFHWNSMIIDAHVNPDFMANGPYFISGDDTSDFAYRVSVSYDFDDL
jgi:hypothetical protein